MLTIGFQFLSIEIGIATGGMGAMAIRAARNSNEVSYGCLLLAEFAVARNASGRTVAQWSRTDCGPQAARSFRSGACCAVVRLDGNHLSICSDRLVEPTQTFESHAKVGKGIGIIGLGRQHSPVTRLGLGQSSCSVMLDTSRP
jgi:hypothetical protein